MIMDKDKTFTFKKDSQIKIPEKYNEEWLKTATMEDKIKFLDEFLNGFNDAYEQPNLYVKVCTDIDSIIIRQQTKIDELNNALEHYKNIEATLQNTLVMAQTTAEEVKNVAKQKADQIVDEAKSSAQKKVDELNNEIVLKQKELDDVKKQFDIYKAKMESLLISQLELLKEVNKED